MLNNKAAELQREQEHLKAEQRGLQQALAPLRSHFDAEVLRDTLQQFGALCEAAQPQEMQQLVRTLVHRIEWQPDGKEHAVELYALPKMKNQPSSFDKDWLETMVWTTWPRPRTFEPLIYRLHLTTEKVTQVLSASVRAIKTS